MGGLILGIGVASLKFLVQIYKVPAKDALLFSGPVMAVGVFALSRYVVMFWRGHKNAVNPGAS